MIVHWEWWYVALFLLASVGVLVLFIPISVVIGIAFERRTTSIGDEGAVQTLGHPDGKSAEGSALLPPATEPRRDVTRTNLPLESELIRPG